MLCVTSPARAIPSPTRERHRPTTAWWVFCFALGVCFAPRRFLAIRPPCYRPSQRMFSDLAFGLLRGRLRVLVLFAHKAAVHAVCLCCVHCGGSLESRLTSLVCLCCAQCSAGFRSANGRSPCTACPVRDSALVWFAAAHACTQPRSHPIWGQRVSSFARCSVRIDFVALNCKQSRRLLFTLLSLNCVVCRLAGTAQPSPRATAASARPTRRRSRSRAASRVANGNRPCLCLVLLLLRAACVC